MKLRATVRQSVVRLIRASPPRLRSLLSRGSALVLAETTPPAPPVPPVELATTRPVELPDGLDEPSLRAVYATWSIDGEPPGHMDPYVGDSFYRFLHTWSLARSERGRCLELGANPYFTTYLLADHCELELSLANYFDGSSEEGDQILRFRGPDGEAEERRFHYAQFNIEDSDFPYPDASFDLVVFAEILEHLLMDPVSVLLEIRRILTDDGKLILTTPNVARAENAFRLVDGSNIYDPYSGYGPYGRHNREYTMAELTRLLDFVGFEVEESFTGDGHPTDHRGAPFYDAVAPLLAGRGAALGGYLFVRARKAGEPRVGLPDFLYRSYPPDRLVQA